MRTASGRPHGACGQQRLNARQVLAVHVEAARGGVQLRPGTELARVGGDGEVPLDGDAVAVDHDQGLRGGFALDVQWHIDGDRLAEAHDHQVDVLDGVLQRVTLNLLRQREPCGHQQENVDGALNFACQVVEEFDQCKD